MLVGPKGSGKNELAAQFAAMTNRPFYCWPFASLEDPVASMASFILKDGTTFVKHQLFLLACRLPRCVIHIEEINRPREDKGYNPLLRPLDPNERSIYVQEQAEVFPVAAGVTFFASGNFGYEYIGTSPLDPALEDRFPTRLVLDYLPQTIETALIIDRTGLASEKVIPLVQLIARLRQQKVEISTRTSIELASWIKEGLSIQEAVALTVKGDKETVEKVVLSEHLAGSTTKVQEDKYVPLAL